MVNQMVVLFDVAGRRVALPTAAVQSVVELDAISPVPRAPGFVLGLAALRSSTLTAIDTAAAIGLAPGGMPQAGARMAIVDHDGHRYALAIDGIDDVAEVLAPPTPLAGEAGGGWQRVACGLIETSRGPAVLLDLAAVLAGPPAQAA